MSSEDSDEDGQELPVPERLRSEAEWATESIDESLVELLAWVLDTETRARIYVYLRQSVWSTSGEVAEGTGLYPSTVREALAALHDEELVERRKRKAAGAGNNPYEYAAIAPSELVESILEEVQSELNTVFNLDELLGGEEPTSSPVSITVEEATTEQVEGDD